MKKASSRNLLSRYKTPWLSNLEVGIIIGKDSYKVILTAITIVKRSVEKEYD